MQRPSSFWIVLSWQSSFLPFLAQTGTHSYKKSSYILMCKSIFHNHFFFLIRVVGGLIRREVVASPSQDDLSRVYPTSHLQIFVNRIVNQVSFSETKMKRNIQIQLASSEDVLYVVAGELWVPPRPVCMLNPQCNTNVSYITCDVDHHITLWSITLCWFQTALIRPTCCWHEQESRRSDKDGFL